MDSTAKVTLRPSQNFWQVADHMGGIRQFQWRGIALLAAFELLVEQPGIIEIFDTDGEVTQTIDPHRPLGSR